jgi:hypothetical protein
MRGKDWLGNEMTVFDTHGVYESPEFRVTTRLDPETGDHIQEREYVGRI